jgi:hypothetical protein
MRPTDLFIPAPPEMVDKMLTRTGINKDYDKDPSQMNDEGKLLTKLITNRASGVRMLGRR